MKAKWGKYRYEFMRRDPEYNTAWQEVIKLRNKAEFPPDYKIEETTDKGVKTVIYPYWNTPEGEREREICNKFDMLRIMRDPAISYDDINDKRFIYLPFSAKAISVRKVIRQASNVRKISDGYLPIEINFNEVNSIDALKKEVAKTIDYYWKYINGRHNTTQMREYDIIYKVGVLKEVNSAHSRIATELYPTEPIDSAIDKVKKKYRRYKKLIKGGWRKMKFP